MKTLMATIGWFMVGTIAANVSGNSARADDLRSAAGMETVPPSGVAQLEGVDSAQTTEAPAVSDLERSLDNVAPLYTIDFDIDFDNVDFDTIDFDNLEETPRRPSAGTLTNTPQGVLFTPAGPFTGTSVPVAPVLPETVPRSEVTDASSAEAEPTEASSPEVSATTEEASASTIVMELTPVTSPVIPANRRSTVTLEGRITDAAGNPLPRDVVVTLTAAAGEFQGADFDRDQAGFQVLARQGQFQVVLQSGLEAQQVRLRAAASGYAVQGLDPDVTLEPLPDVEAFTQVEFITNLRPSLVAGVVDLRLGPGATDFWGSFGDFLNPNDIGETEFDLGAALFAIGTLGEWQFTGAVNSERALNETCDGNRLFRDDQFCDSKYPVYGDSSQVDHLTPSIDSFYARFQRDSRVPGSDPDYFMWGDYTTEEFARSSQEFTAITRQLHGFKGNYTLGNLQISALFANNLRPFQRDTIAPDGTSGYYFLSRRVILPGSEDIFLETEEINRPGTVIERRRLTRVSDYEIDYDRGTLLFREPILRTEVDPFGKTLVRRIVATYQVDETSGDGNLYAGRLQYNFRQGAPQTAGWAAVTLLSEDQGEQDFSLYGFDVNLPLGDQGLFTGEFARSSFERFGESADGNAYRVEIQGPLFSPSVEGAAYLRTAESGFSNTATTSFRPGQTRWGGRLSAGLGTTTRLNLQFDQETNRGQTPEVTTDAFDLLSPGQFETPGEFVDNTLTTIQAGVSQQFGSVNLAVDWVNRDRRDRLNDIDTNSNQLIPRLAIPITSALSFRAQSELNFGSEEDPLYPDRTTLAFDWTVQPGVTMRLAQQFVGGGSQPGSITSLDTLVDYELGDNTSLRSRYSLIGGYGGIIGQAALGLNHRIVLAPGLRANFGIERVIDDAFNETGAGQQFAQPFAVGSGASALGIQGGTSFSIGLEYTDNPDFQASARVEHRNSSSGNNTVFTAAAGGKISPALTTLFRYQQANFANQQITGILGNSINLKLGLAYRNPASDQFNGLLSYEYRRNPATTPDTILIDNDIGSADHTLALEAIYAPNWRWEFYGKYAFRISNANLAEDLEFSNSIHLMQLRAAYRFAYRWDVLGEIRYITQPAANYNEIGSAIELGYYLTPDLRLGVGYSFGRANNDGFGGDGTRSAGGPYLGVQFKVNELINDFGLQQVAPRQQEESYVETPETLEILPDEGFLEEPGTAADDSDGTELPENTGPETIEVSPVTVPLPATSEPGGSR